MSAREIEAVAQLARRLASRARDEVRAATVEIAALLARATPEDLAWLDPEMRYALAYEGRHRDLGDATILKLLSFHYSGFEREEAVKRLAQIDDGSELTFLLLRLGDWVPQVRAAAREAIVARAADAHIDGFLRNLGVIARLQETKHADSETLEAIARLLSGPRAREAMLAALADPARERRRAAFRILTAAMADDREAIALAAWRSPDPYMRLWALRTASGSLVERASADPVSAVRLEALTMRADPAAWTAALLDRAAGVRDAARFHLRETGLDFAQLYRGALSGGRLATALTGLAETGGAADLERVTPYLSHPRARIRRAAVKASIRLGGEDAVGRVIATLGDAARSVSAQARDSLKRFAAAVGGGRLWGLVEWSTVAHSRMNALHLIAALPKWEAIGYLLRAAGQADDALSSKARDYVVRWNAVYNRSQSAPTGEQLRRAAEALAHAGSTLSERVAADITFAIRSAQPE